MSRHGSRVWLTVGAALLTLAVVAGSAAAAGPADSAWPMFQHDPQHTGRSPTVAPSKLAVKWRFRVYGEPGSPAIGRDGTIYLPTGSEHAPDSAGFLYAIKPNGTLRWRFRFPAVAGCVIVPGITTPAVASDGTVYVHTESGKTVAGSGHCTAGPSFVYAINPRGGQKWVYQLNLGSAVFQGAGISSPAIGSDGTVYVTSRDAGLHALDPATGHFKWIASPAATSIGSSPAIGRDGTIYVNVFGVHAYAPNGHALWSVKVGNGCCIDSSPTVGADGTIYACGMSPDVCEAITPAGKVKWTFPIRVKDSTSPALGADGTIYLTAPGSGSGSVIYALNRNGTQRWHVSFASGMPGVSHTPIVGGDGRIYDRGDLGLGSTGFTGSLFVLNPNGSTADRTTIPPAQSEDGELSLAIGSDGTLYAPQLHDVTGVPYNPSDQYLVAYKQRLVRPVLTGLKLNPADFRAARSGASIAVKTGTTVSYRVSGVATTRFTVERAVPGVMHGNRCVKPTPGSRKGKPCTRFVPVGGSFTHSDRVGVNRFHFSGRIGGKALTPDGYRLVATPRNAAGMAGRTVGARFHIVRY